jgi:sugar lactone lactonase YvrE
MMRRIVCGTIVSVAVLLNTAASADAEKVVLVAGGGDKTPPAPATQAKLIAPFGVDFDKAGNLFIVELSGQRVLKVDDKGLVTTIAGTASQKGEAVDGGLAAKASFNGMHSLAIAPTGAIYLADTWNNCVRKIDPQSGMISRVAGTGQKGFSGDGGPAVKAQFGGIYCVALDLKAEKLYLADLDNRRIRVVNLQSGNVDTVAGNGQKGVPQDGADARKAPLVDPRAVAVDSAGNVYILDRSGHALRVVDSSGKIRTVAGTGQRGFDGDGGDALKATMNGPKHLCIDHGGNVLIADTENHVIRKYLPKEGKIVRVAGTGKKGTGGVGGPPEKVELSQPHGVIVHPSGEIYITDSSNNRVLKIVR